MAITTSGTTLTFNDSTTQTTAPVNTNANVNSVSAGTGISVNSTTGAVTVTNSGVTSVAAGTGISVSGSTGGVTITNSAPAVTAGEAKAWVRFNGSGGATINASYNVSSVTRSAAGQYYLAFTNAISDANYAVAGSAQSTSGAAGAGSFMLNENVTPPVTTTNCYFGILNKNVSSPYFADSPYISVVVFR